ncbi:SWI/SNF-related matrix-associated actin-dependent regulator of chromatin subfamily A-like protein 1 isoform X2 [Dysidea avara]|uniref:SWI/SNF-related matrix-associated actin-dependent regulator of chromatin subfamily A-like protein 1 isoform X2 n=1 Tax=Dysidea avara TaxID=196820 RepID=UPI0033325DFD
MSLSEEQLRRIEENKRKAQQKLLERKRQCPTVGNDTVPPAKRPVTVIPPSSRPYNSNEIDGASSSRLSSNKNSSRPQQGSSKSFNKPKYGGKKPIKLDFTLISKTRFEVVSPYQSNIIDVFKQIPSRSYDAKRTIWSFGIEDHNNLVSSLKKQCSGDTQLEMDYIPKAVVNMFVSLRSKEGVVSKEKPIDLSSRVDDKLVNTLMPFQREGVEFGIHHKGRVLIADDMGLGKTLQAICIAAYYREVWPLLILCPSSVRQMWGEAFEYWLPSLKEEEINVLYHTQDTFHGASIVIASYDTLSRVPARFSKENFQIVIADESHFLKNHKTARSKAAIPLLKNARFAILLSGTPALSRPIELYTQVTSLDRHFGMSLFDFGKRYCAAVKTAWAWDFSGASHLRELQLYMEACVMIRRLKCDVLDQLPEKRRQMVSLDPTINNDSREFEDMRKKLDLASHHKSKTQHSQLLQLYEETGRMKLPGIRDYIIDRLEGGQKSIVFAHHRVVLDSICDLLRQKKRQHIRIDGKTLPTIRQNLCDQFQHDENCIAAVLSITTANAGLTLTAASSVIFAELFWNPGILVQAEDRAYRIGQKNSVNIQYLVARGTADDFIWPMIQRKLSILSQAGLAGEDFSGATNTVIKTKNEKSLLSYFESLSECQELLTESPYEEDKMEDFVSPQGKVPSNRAGSLLEHFGSNCKHSKSHSSCNLGSNISDPQSIEDTGGSHDLVMSQEEIDDLFMITDEECWFSDIT